MTGMDTCPGFGGAATGVGVVVGGAVFRASGGGGDIAIILEVSLSIVFRCSTTKIK